MVRGDPLKSASTLRHIRCRTCRALQQIGCQAICQARTLRARYSDGAVVVEFDRILMDDPLVFRCHRCGALDRVDEAIDLQRRDGFL
jgi:hypothetical protein